MTRIYKTLDEIPPDRLFERKPLSQALAECGVVVPVATLATMAVRGKGLPYQKFGKRALYRWADVVAWIMARMTPPVSNSSQHRINSPRLQGGRAGEAHERSNRSGMISRP